MSVARGKHHFRIGYATSMSARIYSAVLIPVVSILIIIGILWILGEAPVFSLSALEPGVLFSALFLTLIRLAAAYVLAVIVAVPLSLLAVKSPLLEQLLLPTFDVIQSVPVLAFFPVLILVFAQTHFIAGAAIFILFLSMVWNLVFSLVGGLNVMPSDIKAAAHVFGISGMRYLRVVLLPSVVPYLVTGSLLAWAQGWNIIIVAEVLHTYIPNGTAAYDLLGLGSLLVNAAATGQNEAFIYTLLAMVAAIALMNIFIWQRLLKYAERFRFE